MNKSGQTVFYTFMLAVVIVILALAFAPTLKSFTDSARAPSSDTAIGLDCSNATISNFNKANCMVTDLTLPYFIIGLVAIAGIVIGARAVLGGSNE